MMTLSRRRTRAAGAFSQGSSFIKRSLPLLLLLLALPLLTACPSDPEPPSLAAKQAVQILTSLGSAADDLHAVHDPAVDQSWRQRQYEAFKVFLQGVAPFSSPEPLRAAFQPDCDRHYAHSCGRTPEAKLLALREPQRDIFDPQIDDYYAQANDDTALAWFYSLPGELQHLVFDARYDLFFDFAAKGLDHLHAALDPLKDTSWLNRGKKKSSGSARRMRPLKFPGDTPLEQFTNFAKYWVEKVNRNRANNANNLTVNESENGAFTASFQAAEPESLQLEVKPSESSLIPFVGVMRYMEKHYECSGATPDDAKKGPFKVTKQTKMTEIFGYAKDHWRE